MSESSQFSGQSRVQTGKTGQSEDIDKMSRREDENLSYDSLEVASSSRSLRSGSSNSLHSDDVCSVLCEQNNADNYTLPDYMNGNKDKDEQQQSNARTDEFGTFVDLTQRRKSTPAKTNLRSKRRNTTDATSMCTSIESLSSLYSPFGQKTQCSSVRHNKMSLARHQMAHSAHSKSVESNADDYLTPLQKKERVISDLREELKSTRQVVSDLESQVITDQEECERKIKSSIEDRDREIEILREVVEDLRTSIASITSSHQAEEERANRLEQQLQQVKDEMKENEIRNQDLFLKMYTKGQKSAKIERQLQLEELASANPVAVGVSELMEKLELTQAQLDRWQILRRQETYEGVEIPGTDSEVRLRFMRDSLFHFLTSGNDADVHLTAMIKVAEFTNVQLDKIQKAMFPKKKKGK